MGKTVRKGIEHQKRWMVPDVKDIEVVKSARGTVRAKALTGSKSHFDGYYGGFSTESLKSKKGKPLDVNKLVKSRLNKFKSGKYIKKITPDKEVDGRKGGRLEAQLFEEGIRELSGEYDV